MSEIKQNKGITIGELKKFLAPLSSEYDDFGLVNGEVFKLDEEYFVRLDKPIIHLEIDMENSEFLILHQSREKLENILKEINGDSKGT